jgi:hypothetical protein
MEAMMKPVLACLAAVSLFAVVAPAGAQEYLGPRGALGAYDGYYDYEPPVPPRPVPHYRDAPVETVVTTTRRFISQPDYEAYAPETVVTTRRAVEPGPVYSEPVGVVATGSLALPPRRVTKNVVFAPERIVAPRHVAPPPSVLIEERRVVTTRRILRPVPAQWE